MSPRSYLLQNSQTAPKLDLTRRGLAMCRSLQATSSGAKLLQRVLRYSMRCRTRMRMPVDNSHPRVLPHRVHGSWVRHLYCQVPGILLLIVPNTADLKGWGWNIFPEASEDWCNWEHNGFWGFASYFRFRGISDRCVAYGGLWEVLAIFHGSGTDENDLDDQVYVGLDDLTHRVCILSLHRNGTLTDLQATGAEFYMGINAAQGGKLALSTETRLQPDNTLFRAHHPQAPRMCRQGQRPSSSCAA